MEELRQRELLGTVETGMQSKKKTATRGRGLKKGRKKGAEEEETRHKPRRGGERSQHRELL